MNVTKYRIFIAILIIAAVITAVVYYNGDLRTPNVSEGVLVYDADSRW